MHNQASLSKTVKPFITINIKVTASYNVGTDKQTKAAPIEDLFSN